MELRPYQPADLPHLVRVCVATGDNGRDATPAYSRPELLARYYLEPYLRYDAPLCLTLVDTEGPCGYIVGVADTRAFIAWFNAAWLPVLREDYRDWIVAPGSRDAWLREQLWRDAAPPTRVEEFPAHLHVDLLPRTQGLGWGRRMMERWIELVSERGAAGVHVGVGVENREALRFYERLGFRRLDDEDGVVLGLRFPGGR